MDNKEVCIKLLNAESEAEVSEIIDFYAEFSDQNNWSPLDRRETNFNMTSNQASDGGKALTELMTNMVDAVLMKRAYKKGIDPKSRKAPRTMYDAVDTLVKDLRGGKLTYLDHKDPWLIDFAQKNLVIGITGAKSKRQGLPSYTFVDNGEGQSPDNFEDTFLSLSAGHKKSIPFVQGKFNMGSSGVLGYCGTSWYKLIVSRCYDGKSPWGWTIMRRRPGDAEELPIAEYFIPRKTGIPFFEEDYMYPFNTSVGKCYDGVFLKTGTIIKLYDYNVGRAHLSFRGARETMIENLVETILPFRLLDFRQTPDKSRGGDRAEGIDPRPFYGMEYLLLRSHKESDAEDEEDAAGEGKIFVGQFEDNKLGRITVNAVPLKRKLPGWLKNSKNRVFHAVNGQVQFKQTRGYLSQSCGFPALKDRVVLIVDASRLTFTAHAEVWKGDREHIRNTLWGERYKDIVTTTVKESEALKGLQQKIAKQELERTTESESDELFQKLVDSDRNFAGLLSSRNPKVRLPSAGGEHGKESGSGEFEGKYSPTFLRLEERSKIVDLPINRTRPVTARTDAENGYLNRSDNRGRVLIDTEIRAKFTIREHLHNGRLVLYFDPNRDALKIGDTLTFEIGLKDDAIPETTKSEELVIRVVDREKESGEKRRRKKEKQKSGEGDSNKEGKGKDSPTLGLPVYELLTHDGREISGKPTQQWLEDFGGEDGGYAEDLGGGNIKYYINYDNVYHLKYKEQQRGDIAKDAVTEKYILGMRIMMLGFEQSLRSAQQSREASNENFAEYIDQFRRMAAQGSASTVLALAENLPKIIDASAVQNNEDE